MALHSARMAGLQVPEEAFDALEDLDFPLRERAGRKTLSAEDLLDFAIARIATRSEERFSRNAETGV